MANTKFNIRIQSKVDSLEKWQLVQDTFIPLAGEICVVEIPSGNTSITTAPSTLIKIGDGTTVFKNLPYLSATAADVASFLKKDSNGATWTQANFEAWIKGLVEVGDLDLSDYATDKELADAVATINAEIEKKANIANVYTRTEVDTTVGGINDNVSANAEAIEKLNGADTVDGSVAKSIKDALVPYATSKYVDDSIKIVSDDVAKKVATVTAGDASVTVGGTATAPTVAVKVSKDTNNAVTLEGDGLKVVIPTAAEYSIVKAENSGDYAAIYNLTKDGAIVGAPINIPKDMVVKSGSIVTNPDGQAEGTYIELVLQNDEANPLYINVGDLIEYVTSGSATGDMVVINVSDDHKVTATITDGTVTLAKLHANVQAEINKAHIHDNKTVLDGITADKVTAWDKTQANTIQALKDDSAIKSGFFATEEYVSVKEIADDVQSVKDSVAELTIDDIGQDDGTYIVLNCGSSTVNV